MAAERSEQEEVRREKLRRAREVGYPYPNDAVVTATALEVRNSAEDQAKIAEGDQKQFAIAGRILTLRLMGKAAFFHIQDRSGRVQVYLKKDEIGDEAFEKFKEFDLGDIVWCSGTAFITKTGEPSLHARGIRLLTKCLRPLPEKWHGLSDVEVRYRKRYLDLIVTPESREAFKKRSQITAQIRRFFDDRDYLEVETPMMSSISSGAAARPFITHHNALDLRLNLRIALELPLKKLVVGGLERVYELGRVFRNEGISTQHNPEFTMLEFYEAYATFEDLMNLTEELVISLCDKVIGSRKIKFEENEIDYTPPWKRMSMVESIYHFTDLPRSIDLYTMEGVKQAVQKLDLHGVEGKDDYGVLIFELFDQKVQSQLISPTFITLHPLSVSPLARPNLEDKRFVDRFELFINGLEVANAFSELNDPEDQEERFRAQLELKAKGDLEAMDTDDDFVEALEYGLPPTAGEGIGIDRLTMLLTGQPSIRDVILFPQMRPEKAAGK